MAKSRDSGDTEVRVLCTCQYGAPDEVATLSGGDLSDALAAGLVDDNPEAVAYAKTLAAPKEGV
jgi:hypothetical protein